MTRLSSFWKPINFTTHCNSSRLKNARSWNHQVTGGILLFNDWVLLVSNENLTLKQSEEKEENTHDVASLAEASRVTSDSTQFCTRLEDVPRWSIFWHCFRAARRPFQLQQLISFRDLSICWSKFSAPTTTVLSISMLEAAECSRQMLNLCRNRTLWEAQNSSLLQESRWR